MANMISNLAFVSGSGLFMASRWCNARFRGLGFRGLGFKQCRACGLSKMLELFLFAMKLLGLSGLSLPAQKQHDASDSTKPGKKTVGFTSTLLDFVQIDLANLISFKAVGLWGFSQWHMERAGPSQQPP